MIRWFRNSADLHWGFDSSGPEFRRLMNAAGDCGIPIWQLAVAAEMIAARGVCDRAEAWDRLAFNLERMRTA